MIFVGANKIAKADKDEDVRAAAVQKLTGPAVIA